MVVQLGIEVTQALASFKPLPVGQPVQTAGVPSAQVSQLLVAVQAPHKPSAVWT